MLKTKQNIAKKREIRAKKTEEEGKHEVNKTPSEDETPDNLISFLRPNTISTSDRNDEKAPRYLQQEARDTP